MAVGLSYAALLSILDTPLFADSLQTAAEAGHASANRDDASLNSLYESHQWFKLGDAVTKTGASAFYRGAVAYAFDHARQAEHYLNPVIASAPQSERASDARTMLINLYMRTGRYRKAFSATEKERAVSPDDAGLKTASALLSALSQSPEQEVSRRRSSEIRYTTKEGNLFIPVDINGKRANYILDMKLLGSSCRQPTSSANVAVPGRRRPPGLS